MRRGFTLIELLAVIVILAIIALIAVPVVINIINDSKKESISRSVELYMDHVQKTITQEQLKNSKYNPDTCKIQKDGDLICSKGEEELTTSNGTKILKVEMNGKKPSNGTIKINNNKISYENVLLENIYHHMDEAGQKTTTTEEQVITIGEDTSEETGDTLVTIQSGPNKDKAIKKGTVITIGTENFYVYKYSNNIVYAIAKYNLKVGGVYNSGYTAYTPSEVTNLQDSEMRGWIIGQSEWKGTTPFSSSEVHGTNYSSYEGSIVEGYVNEYKSKLEAIGAEIEEARLITKEELEGLGCSSSGYSGYTCNSAPSFIYSTSYWSGSACNPSNVWGVYSIANFDDVYTFDNSFGVRPVIGISISEI